MDRSQKAYRNITEAASEIGVEAHVLRYWETRFPLLKPMTRGGGRRFYSVTDMGFLQSIHYLLYVEGLPIRAVNRRIQQVGLKALIAETLPKIKKLQMVEDPERADHTVFDNLISQLATMIERAERDIDWLRARISHLSTLEYS